MSVHRGRCSLSRLTADPVCPQSRLRNLSRVRRLLISEPPVLSDIFGDGSTQIGFFRGNQLHKVVDKLFLDVW